MSKTFSLVAALCTVDVVFRTFYSKYIVFRPFFILKNVVLFTYVVVDPHRKRHTEISDQITVRSGSYSGTCHSKINGKKRRLKYVGRHFD